MPYFRKDVYAITPRDQMDDDADLVLKPHDLVGDYPGAGGGHTREKVKFHMYSTGGLIIKFAPPRKFLSYDQNYVSQFDWTATNSSLN